MVAVLPGEGSSAAATASAVDDCRSLAASSTSQYSGVVGRSELASLPVPVRRKGDDDADGASGLADGGVGGTSLPREGEVLRTHT